MIDPKAMPEIKREKVSTVSVDEFEVEGSGGKKHQVQEETFTEKEIEITKLVKLAPMYWFSPETNKILLIPFSIQFSVMDFSKQLAGASLNLEEMLKKMADEAKAARK